MNDHKHFNLEKECSPEVNIQSLPFAMFQFTLWRKLGVHKLDLIQEKLN